MSFSPGDIRPVDLEKAKAREIQRDIEWLSARLDQFIEVPCPSCSKNNGTPAFEKYGFSFLDCPHCRTVYMSPRATSEVMAEFYSRSTNYEFWDKHVFPASRKIRRDKIFQPRVTRLCEMFDRFHLSADIAVDVGASVGIFLEALRETGRFRRLVAVEPNVAQADTCRKLGFETLEMDFSKINRFSEPVSLITAFEVIEHLFSPREFLKHCYRLLGPRGVVAITCPNQMGFDIQTLGSKSLSFDVEHVNMFNPNALSKLFEMCGFRVVECSTPGELDAQIVRDAAIDGSFLLENQPFLRTVLIDRWDELGNPFQAFLKSAGMSSSMWIAAVYDNQIFFSTGNK